MKTNEVEGEYHAVGKITGCGMDDDEKTESGLLTED